MSNGTKWFIGIIIVILLLLLACCGYKYYNCNKAAKALDSELFAANATIITLNDSIDALNLLLEDCPKKAKKRTQTKRQPNNQGQGGQTPQPEQTQKQAERTRPTVPADNPSRTENTGLCGDQYMGVYNGSHGVTINEESKLVYFTSNEEQNAGEGKLMLPAPILNNADSGDEFYWDASKNLWIYESNTIITIARLLDGTPVIWCTYLGTHSQWGYKMFNPHEILKTGSSSARTALSNGEVRMHDPSNLEMGADYVSVIQFKKR